MRVRRLPLHNLEETLLNRLGDGAAAATADLGAVHAALVIQRTLQQAALFELLGELKRSLPANH